MREDLIPKVVTCLQIEALAVVGHPSWARIGSMSRGLGFGGRCPTRPDIMLASIVYTNGREKAYPVKINLHVRHLTEHATKWREWTTRHFGRSAYACWHWRVSHFEHGIREWRRARVHWTHSAAQQAKSHRSILLLVLGLKCSGTSTVLKGRGLHGQFAEHHTKNAGCL